jgi:hypothetical protein
MAAASQPTKNEKNNAAAVQETGGNNVVQMPQAENSNLTENIGNGAPQHVEIRSIRDILKIYRNPSLTDICAPANRAVKS